MESGSSKDMVLTLNDYIILKRNLLAHQVIALLSIRQEVLGDGKFNALDPFEHVSRKLGLPKLPHSVSFYWSSVIQFFFRSYPTDI